MAASERSIDPGFLISGVVTKLRRVKSMIYFDLVDKTEMLTYLLNKSTAKIKISCQIMSSQINEINEFDEVLVKGEFGISNSNQYYLKISHLLVQYSVHSKVHSDQENANNSLAFASQFGIPFESIQFKTVLGAKDFLVQLGQKTQPTWSREIPIGKQKTTLKTQIKRFLNYFEDFLNLIVGEEKRTAEVVLRPEENALVLEVVSLDFLPEEIESWYNQYIQFVADPGLTEDLIDGLQDSKSDLSQEKIDLVEQIQQTLSKLNLEKLDNKFQFNLI